MKIAIPTEHGQVCKHFGRSPEFTIFTIKNNKVVKKEMIQNPGHSTGFLPKYFHDLGINTIICGGAGWRAQQFFTQYNIDFILGVTGNVNRVIKKCINGKLKQAKNLCEPHTGKGYGIEKKDI